MSSQHELSDLYEQKKKKRLDFLYVQLELMLILNLKIMISAHVSHHSDFWLCEC